MKEELFKHVVYIFASSCWQSLGKVPNPMTGKEEKNLDMAKQAIDILEVLESRTKGNLTSQEETFLQQSLTDMRLNYIEEASKKTEKASPETDKAAAPEAKHSDVKDSGEAHQTESAGDEEKTGAGEESETEDK